MLLSFSYGFAENQNLTSDPIPMTKLNSKKKLVNEFSYSERTLGFFSDQIPSVKKCAYPS